MDVLPRWHVPNNLKSQVGHKAAVSTLYFERFTFEADAGPAATPVTTRLSTKSRMAEKLLAFLVAVSQSSRTSLPCCVRFSVMPYIRLSRSSEGVPAHFLLSSRLAIQGVTLSSTCEHSRKI